jgi:dTMP kinase
MSGNERGVKRGLLIVFEGLDGCGKSTQLQRLAKALEARGLDVVTTRQPTDGPVGRKIRAMAQSGERVPPETELEWFMEDRREHLRDTVAPALAAGSVVLSDRYFLSSVAYQGARGLDPQQILRDSEREFPLPDLALLFEIEAELGIRRIAERGGVAEPVFEEQEFLSEAAKIFADLDRPYITRIDARPDPETIHRVVLDRVAALQLDAR